MVALLLTGMTAVPYRAHWSGGPDFALEIAGEDDRTLVKLPFYESVRTRELLIVERNPWALRLYRLMEGSLRLVDISAPDDPRRLRSEVLPLSFRLTAGGTGDEGSSPHIAITHYAEQGAWRVQPKPRRAQP